MSNAHKLNRTSGTQIPLNICCIHTDSKHESHPSRQAASIVTLRRFHSLRFKLEGTKVTRASETTGDNPDLFWSHLLMSGSDKTVTWIFGFDLWNHLTKLGFWRLLGNRTLTTEPKYKTEPDAEGNKRISWRGKMCLENRPFFIVCRAGNAVYQFVDLANFWPSGLHGIARECKIPVVPLPEPWSDESEWTVHCANRVEIVLAAVMSLVSNWRYEQCGPFQLTAAMLALSHFKHTCPVRTADGKKLDIVFQPDHKSHELEREAYFGGRTQCFYVGERTEKVYHIDCNSLYPYVMRDNYFPRRFVSYSKTDGVEKLRLSREVYGMVASVEMDSPIADFPIRIDGLQYHVTGRYWATLCGPELLRALDAGIIKSVFVVQYYSMALLFRDWVDYWHNRKIASEQLNGDASGEREFCKMILNSLYGKFAQRSKQWVDVPERIPLVQWGAWPEYDYRTGKSENWRGVGGHSQKLVDGKEPKHSFPLISAYITAHAREYMRTVIKVCGAENVLYTATDSLILTEAGFSRAEVAGLIHPTKLGKFKVKGIHNYVRITGSNYYQLDDTITCAGLFGASLAQGGSGDTVDLSDSLQTIIQREMPEEIVIESVPVPATRPDFRGRIDTSGRWTPYRVQDEYIMSGQLAALAARREYSLGTVAGRIALTFDV